VKFFRIFSILINMYFEKFSLHNSIKKVVFTENIFPLIIVPQAAG
jgi:hypothetical protein